MEPLEIMEDVSIPQAEMTSLGLNDHDLLSITTYSAAICCNLTNGKMPHIANKICTDILHITHSGKEAFIKNTTEGTDIVYKFFSIEENTTLSITARGQGSLQIYLDDQVIGDMTFNNEAWDKNDVLIDASYQHVSLKLTVKEGNLDVLTLGFK